jgi:hypothetical protein
MSLKRLASFGGSEAPIIAEKEKGSKSKRASNVSPSVSLRLYVVKSCVVRESKKMVAFICCNPTVREKQRERI